MPGTRDTTDGDASSSPRKLVDDDSQAVGFLHLPDLETEAVVNRILHGFTQLQDDAIITVYCTRVNAEMLTDISRSHGLEVVHSVPHDAGTTFVLKRSSPCPDTQPGSP